MFCGAITLRFGILLLIWDFRLDVGMAGRGRNGLATIAGTVSGDGYSAIMVTVQIIRGIIPFLITIGSAG